jgi:hypothetical protein
MHERLQSVMVTPNPDDLRKIPMMSHAKVRCSALKRQNAMFHTQTPKCDVPHLNAKV